MAIAESQDIGLDIDCPFHFANDFLSVPENFPRWATGLGKSLRREADAWICETPAGPMRVEFTPRNEFGVLDHRLTPTDQKPIEVPFRVIKNGDGCHVVLTLFRLPDMTTQQSAADPDWVQRDLNRLRDVLEKLAIE